MGSSEERRRQPESGGEKEDRREKETKKEIKMRYKQFVTFWIIGDNSARRERVIFSSLLASQLKIDNPFKYFNNNTSFFSSFTSPPAKGGGGRAGEEGGRGGGREEEEGAEGRDRGGGRAEEERGGGGREMGAIRGGLGMGAESSATICFVLIVSPHPVIKKIRILTWSIVRKPSPYVTSVSKKTAIL